MQVFQDPEVAAALSTAPSTDYVVWGSSTGWLAFYGALAYGWQAHGVELLPGLVEVARDVAERHGCSRPAVAEKQGCGSTAVADQQGSSGQAGVDEQGCGRTAAADEQGCSGEAAANKQESSRPAAAEEQGCGREAVAEVQGCSTGGVAFTCGDVLDETSLEGVGCLMLTDLCWDEQLVRKVRGALPAGGGLWSHLFC